MSAGTFMAMNPLWRAYPVFLKGLQRDYALRAESQEWSRWDIPGKVTEFLTGSYVLGPLLGSLALLVFLLAIAELVRPGRSSVQRPVLAMFVTFPIAYVIFYAVNTAYFKSNNFLPLVPFACLTMAWALVSGWQWAAVHLRPGPRVGTHVALAAVAMALLVPGGFIYVYRSLVPTTLDVALRDLGSRLRRHKSGRVVAVEKMPVLEPRWDGERRFLRGQSALRFVDSIEGLEEGQLDKIDGLVFPASRLEEERDLYKSLSESRYVSRLVRRFGSVRGPPLVVVMNRWRLRGPTIDLESERCWGPKSCVEARIGDPIIPGEFVSLTVKVRTRSKQSASGHVALTYGNQKVELFPVSVSRGISRFVTPRFRVEELADKIHLESDRRLPAKRAATFVLHRWRRR
jgi:hypothetical protein